MGEMQHLEFDHEVFQRADDRAQVPPRYGTAIERLDADATDALRNRVVSAIGSPAKCIQMAIQVGAAGSMCALAESLVDADDFLFVQQSRLVADSLAVAQKSRNIPGGIVIVFSGSAGAPAKVSRRGDQSRSAQRIHARGAAGRLGVEIPEEPFAYSADQTVQDWSFCRKHASCCAASARRVGRICLRRDAHFGESLWSGAVLLRGLLGHGIPRIECSPNKAVSRPTKGFIRGMNIAEPEKAVLHNALVTYLKADQAARQRYCVRADIPGNWRSSGRIPRVHERGRFPDAGS